MTDDEIERLIQLNYKRYESVTSALRDSFAKMDAFIKEKQEENAQHYHFKTRKEMKNAMLRNFNPYSTFSFGKEPPSSQVSAEEQMRRDALWIRLCRESAEKELEQEHAVGMKGGLFAKKPEPPK